MEQNKLLTALHAGTAGVQDCAMKPSWAVGHMDMELSVSLPSSADDVTASYTDS
jgi:hypothetical protein